MKRIITVGECSLDIVFSADGRPLGSMPGGRIVNAAAILAREGLPVIMASDAAADPVGDIVVRFLSGAGVDVSCVDRYTEGRTPIQIFTPSDDAARVLPTAVRYEDYPGEAFDIIWPRYDEGDIIVFGGYYAIDPKMNANTTQFLHMAKERKAILVYVPGFLPQKTRAVTRVMPAILENLELADIVVARNADLELIFGTSGQPGTCYRDHVNFYCRSLINVDAACRHITYFSGTDTTGAEIPDSVATTLMWNAGIVAGVAKALAAAGLSAADLDTPGRDIREQILTSAVNTAAAAARSLTEDWQKTH